MMTRVDLAREFVVNLEQERYRLHLTQAQMADRLGMCLSAYKKMILGGTRKIDFYNVYLLHRINEDAFLRMMGYSAELGDVISELRTLSDAQLSLLKNVLLVVKENQKYAVYQNRYE